jgi:hypothetical protein
MDIKKIKIMYTTKNIIAVSLLFCIGIIAFTACEKVETGKNIPQCIKKKIKKEANSCLSFVAEYVYMPAKTNKIQSRIYQFYSGYPPCIPGDRPIPNHYDEQGNLIDIIVVNDRHIEYNNNSYFFNRYVYQYYKKK